MSRRAQAMAEAWLADADEGTAQAAQPRQDARDWVALSRYTTPTAHIPAGGVFLVCPAATSCGHTVLTATSDEAELMMADHVWDVHDTRRQRQCPDCGGAGTAGGAEIPVECTTCWGQGLISPGVEERGAA